MKSFLSNFLKSWTPETIFFALLLVMNDRNYVSSSLCNVCGTFVQVCILCTTYTRVPLKKLNRQTFLSWVTYTSVCLKLPTFFKSNAKNFCANQKCVFLKILKSPATNHVMHLKFYLWRCFWICIRWIYCLKFFFEIKF